MVASDAFPVWKSLSDPPTTPIFLAALVMKPLLEQPLKPSGPSNELAAQPKPPA